ncbi:Pumilio RNA-binding repeat [Sesbania bispinosa]|nr:Pumilio RNA-binding repeat [Sesbania bispinosa]
MEQRNSVVSRNVLMDPDNRSFEFMPNLPFQYFPSEGHGDDFHGSASQIPNTATVDSFYHPRFQELYNIAAMEEGLQYSTRRLNLLSNSFTNINPSTNYNHISNQMMNGIGSSSGYTSGNSSFESVLREIRLRVAIEATAQRMSMQCSSDSLFNSGDRDYQPLERRRSVELVRERVVSMAKDYSGCRLLQTKIDEGRAEEISMILSEVRDHLHELMTDTFGNYLIQKIFQATNSVTLQHINSILFFIIFDTRKLKDVCIDSHGTRVVQKILENVNGQQRSAIASALKQIAAALMKNVNGSYVIEKCVKLSPPKCKKVILDEVAKNCVDIATNRWGCSAIQRCWVHDQEEAISLLDPYGNFVAQKALEYTKVWHY